MASNMWVLSFLILVSSCGATKNTGPDRSQDPNQEAQTEENKCKLFIVSTNDAHVVARDAYLFHKECGLKSEAALIKRLTKR